MRADAATRLKVACFPMFWRQRKLLSANYIYMGKLACLERKHRLSNKRRGFAARETNTGGQRRVGRRDEHAGAYIHRVATSSFSVSVNCALEVKEGVGGGVSRLAFFKFFSLRAGLPLGFNFELHPWGSPRVFTKKPLGTHFFRRVLLP
jgi:hypothetical protein